MKSLIALALAPSLVGCCYDCRPRDGGSIAVKTSTSVVPVAYVPDYHVTLTGPDLLHSSISIDLFHDPAKPLQKGAGNVGETPNWLQGAGDLQMALMAPEKLQMYPDGINTKTPSMGIFYNPVNFDQTAVFSVSARFQSPTCMTCTASWSVAVVARSGDVADDGNDTRLQLSLRHKGTTANLRVQEGANDPNTVSIGDTTIDLPTPAYNDIYANHMPLILKLIVNRPKGYGSAQLTILTKPSQPFSIPFKMGLVTAAYGSRTITTVGATLANNNVPYKIATVDVSDFWIGNN